MAATESEHVRILNLSLGQDTGGQQMRLTYAWTDHFPKDQYTTVTSSPTFYTIQNRFQPLRLTRHWWPEADVVHTHNDLNFLNRFRKKLTAKPVLIHHHGTMFRQRPSYHLEAIERYNAVAVVSTLDLWALAPEQTTWLPQAYDGQELRAYRIRQASDVLRVAHAPTNRTIKSTEALIAAVDKLRSEGAAIELDLIERTSNVKCLTRKGRADVYFDQVFLGYGCNSIEAWGMGIPVIAGVDPEGCQRVVRQKIASDTREQMINLWGKLPFMETTEEGIYDALVQMLDPKVRAKYSTLGTKHFARWHEGEKVVTQLRGLYHRAIEQGPGIGAWVR